MNLTIMSRKGVDWIYLGRDFYTMPHFRGLTVCDTVQSDTFSVPNNITLAG